MTFLEDVICDGNNWFDYDTDTGLFGGIFLSL